MSNEIKKEDLVIGAIKSFTHKFNRNPSIQELADFLTWKKSITAKYIDILLKKGKLQQDYDANNRAISKSLRVK